MSASRCLQCELASDKYGPGVNCVMHEASSTSFVAIDVRIDNRPGAIGPVPVQTFAYVVGEVPRFDDDGKRSHCSGPRATRPTALTPVPFAKFLISIAEECGR